MTDLSMQSVSALGYNVPDEIADQIKTINRYADYEQHADLFDAAQEAIDNYAQTMDEEMSETGHYRRGQLSEEACDRATKQLEATVQALCDTIDD